MFASCRTIVTDLWPRLRAKLTFYTTIVHESQGREWLYEPWCETYGDHSCTLLNATCLQLATQSSLTYDRDCVMHFYTSQICWHGRDVYITQNLDDGQKSCIFTHRNYVYIVAMCISQWIWATNKRMHVYTSQLTLLSSHHKSERQ